MPNRIRSVYVLLVMMLLLVMLAACGPSGRESEATESQSTITPTVTPLAVAQPTPTNANVVPSGLTLTIWWPETLAPVGRPEVTELLNEQFTAFNDAEDDTIEIVFRLKRAGTETGSILSTLRTANGVAPAAMPDLTLLRRDDLISAAQAGLIQPLEGFVNSAVIGGLYGSALELGQINGQLYGLPYMTDALLMVYRDPQEAITANAGVSFEMILENGIPFTIPGARPIGLNGTLFVQYLSAGGALVSQDGTPAIDEDALLTVLSFYESARAVGQIGVNILDYTSSAAYLDDFEAGAIESAVLRSDEYINLRANTGIDFIGGSIPTASGDPGTVMNGWMWVMIASTTQQQAVAARFIDWMMQVERQRAYAEAIYMLPSQELAMRTMDRRLVDTNLMDDLLSSALVAGPEATSGTLARAIQNAFINVITGSRSAEEAVADVTALTGE